MTKGASSREARHTTRVFIQHIAPAAAVADATEKTKHLAVQP